MVPLPWLVGLLGFFAAERALELLLNARNVAWLRARGATFAGADGIGPILVGQVALFGGAAIEGRFAPWSGVGWWTWVGLGAIGLAMALRYWVIAALGRRWSIRVVTLPGAARVDGGPYRFLAHPNYAAVALEALALPLAFAAWGTLVVALPLTLLALRRRIRLEDAALRLAYGPRDASR